MSGRNVNLLSMEQSLLRTARAAEMTRNPHPQFPGWKRYLVNHQYSQIAYHDLLRDQSRLDL